MKYTDVFKAYDSQESKEMLVPDRDWEADTHTAYTQFASMTEDDLGAIDDFLRTIPSVMGV